MPLFPQWPGGKWPQVQSEPTFVSFADPMGYEDGQEHNFEEIAIQEKERTEKTEVPPGAERIATVPRALQRVEGSIEVSTIVTNGIERVEHIEMPQGVDEITEVPMALAQGLEQTVETPTHYEVESTVEVPNGGRGARRWAEGRDDGDRVGRESRRGAAGDRKDH